MVAAETTQLPTVRRYRPTDGTGWFWAFLLLLAGLFLSRVSLALGVLCALAALIPFVWQFRKWYVDAAINRHATRWCQTHYPDAGGAPVVDFMVALSHDTGCDLAGLDPSTPLSEINRSPQPDDDIDWDEKHSNCEQAWLAEIARSAKIKHPDMSRLAGSTVHDAICFLLELDRAGDPAALAEFNRQLNEIDKIESVRPLLFDERLQLYLAVTVPAHIRPESTIAQEMHRSRLGHIHMFATLAERPLEECSRYFEELAPLSWHDVRGSTTALVHVAYLVSIGDLPAARSLLASIRHDLHARDHKSSRSDAADIDACIDMWLSTCDDASNTTGSD